MTSFPMWLSVHFHPPEPGREYSVRHEAGDAHFGYDLTWYEKSGAPFHPSLHMEYVRMVEA